MKVFKYPIHMLIGTAQQISCPGIPRIVAFEMQDGSPTFWAEVDPSKAETWTQVMIIGTGHDIPEGWTHRGLVMDGEYVWHLYEEPSF